MIVDEFTLVEMAGVSNIFHCMRESFLCTFFRLQEFRQSLIIPSCEHILTVYRDLKIYS
jgi:hypothetical protein